MRQGADGQTRVAFGTAAHNFQPGRVYTPCGALRLPEFRAPYAGHDPDFLVPELGTLVNSDFFQVCQVAVAVISYAASASRIKIGLKGTKIS